LVPYGYQPAGRGRLTLYRGKGCPTCNFTGLKGRLAIYEVMPVNQALRDMILKNVSAAEIRQAAQAQGMKTLRQAGLQKVIDGVTTMDEIVRATVAE
jgi:type IV pilus assembly protein PilB